MASYLQVENISKYYGDRNLFSNISFNINGADPKEIFWSVSLFYYR